MRLALAVAAVTLALIGTARAGLVVLPGAVAYLNSADVPASLLVGAVPDPVTALIPVPFGTYTSIGAPGLAGDAFSVSLLPNLSITAVTTATSPYCCGPQVQAQISYFIEATGPSAGLVPLNMTGLLNASGATGLGLALVSVGLAGGTPVAAGDVLGNEGLVLDDACNEFNPYACGNQGFVLSLPGGDPPFSVPFMVPSNTVEEVELELYVGTNLGSASGSIDPVITIDPTFLADNPGFSLLLSPNIDQESLPVVSGTPSSPEPASFTLLGAGLAGIGMARRRRR